MTEALKHTPGPWEFTRADYGYGALWNPITRQEVITTGGFNDGDSPITWMGEDLSDGDKALIEAATDLLGAAKAARFVLGIVYSRENGTNERDAIKHLDAAIAKAEGRS